MADSSSVAAGSEEVLCRTYCFVLDVGVGEAHFTACSGLGVEIDVIEYREAGHGEVTLKLPGQVRYEEVTLQFGLTQSTEIWEWLMTAVQGKAERRNCSIKHIDSDGCTELFRYNLLNAWPSKYQCARLNTLSNEVCIDSVTLSFDGLERD